MSYARDSGRGSGVPTALPAMGLQIPKGPKGCGSSNSPELSNGGNRAAYAPKADALISAGRSRPFCFVCACESRPEVNLVCQSSHAF